MLKNNPLSIKTKVVLSAITLVSFLTACTSNIKGTDSATIFINKMVETHEFDKVALDQLF